MSKQNIGIGISGFDIEHYKRTELYSQHVSKLFDNAIKVFAGKCKNLTPDQLKPFSFEDYASVRVVSKQILSDMVSQMHSTIQVGNKQEWLAATSKNDSFLNSILHTSKLSKPQLEAYFDHNLDALKTFQGRKTDGMRLSDRIWRVQEQFKGQLELSLDMALGQGMSADELAREIKKNLVDPDKLFRRIRDSKGNLHLSKAAKLYNPGAGKYRSSYKNAMRLSRTENNMAYRESENERYRKLDFVIGFRIQLSNNHPIPDMCNTLAGDYPKDFIFVGWHPQCRCYVTPILKSMAAFNQDELGRLRGALNDKPYKAQLNADAVTNVPDNFTNYIAGIKDKSKTWQSQPYYIRDNFNGGTIEGGLKNVSTKQKKSLSQINATKTKWEARQAANNAVLSDGKVTLSKALKMKAVDSEALQIAVQAKNTTAIKSEVAKVKQQIVDIKIEEAQIFDMFGGDIIETLHSDYGYTHVEAKKAYDAITAKLKSWEGKTTQELIEKLTYEIDYVGKNKKYNTWGLAQQAYVDKKYLLEIQLEIDNAIAPYLSGASKATINKYQAVKKMLGSASNIDFIDEKLYAFNEHIQSLADKANKVSTKSIKTRKSGTFKYDAKAYTKERRDSAMWETDAAIADDKVRDVSGGVWRMAIDKEKVAAHRYTAGSSYINEPLRQQQYIGQYAGKYSSVDDANYLTDIISRSSYDFDMWVQRGVDHKSPMGIFKVDLYSMDLKEAQKALLNLEGIEPGFSSCSTAKGSGFADKPIIYNIYCPKDTKMLYSEPFSAFGKGTKSPSWDGISKQQDFGYEAEMLLQRGTKFRVTKVDYDTNSDKWYIDLEVIGQI